MDTSETKETTMADETEAQDVPALSVEYSETNFQIDALQQHIRDTMVVDLGRDETGNRIVAHATGNGAMTLTSFYPLDAPIRNYVTEECIAATPESAVTYIARFGLPGQTIGFACYDELQMAVALDYHEPTVAGVKAGTDRHRSIFNILYDPNFQRLYSVDGETISKHAFASLIEDSIPIFVDPNAADMLEVAEAVKFELKDVKRVARDRNTNSYHIEVESDVTADIAIPMLFTIQTPVFLGGPAMSMDVRLFVCTDDLGQPGFRIRMANVDNIKRQMFDAMVKDVSRECGNFPIIFK